MTEQTSEWGFRLWGEVFPCDDEVHARIAAKLPPVSPVVTRSDDTGWEWVNA